MAFGEAAQLLYCAGHYFHVRAQYDQAESFYQGAIAIYQRSLGIGHPDIVPLLEKYADLLRKTQREGEAIQQEQLVKAIHEKNS